MSELQKLKKDLTFWDIFCLASGAMISSGLFVLPGIAHIKVGPALFISYFLAGLLAMTGLLSQAELVSAMPKSGGAYFFVTRSLGPAVGTVQGLLTWFSLILKSAFALVGMAAFTKLIFPALQANDWVNQVVMVLLAVVFVFLNFLGAKKAGKIQVYLVIFLFISLVIYAFYGFSAMKIENLDPFSPYGVESIFLVTGFIFIAYGGLLNVASVAEEVRQAEKIIPQAMIASLVVVTFFYSVIVLITSGILGADELNGTLTPLSLAAEKSMGNWGVILLSLAAIMSFITTANAGILAASRYPMALSRDKLLPGFLSKVHPKFQTPVIAILFSGVILILCLFLKLDILVELASTVLILTFILSHVSVLILRESKIMNYRPTFQSPLYPWIQIVGIILFSFILFQMSKNVFITKVVFISLAFFIYWFYGRIRSEQKYALLHILERLTARSLVTGQLENELKEIIHERDEIVKDRFDHLVEDCLVIDLDQQIKVDQLFEIVASRIASETNNNKERVELQLLKRERNASTTINEDVAIPHIIVEGKDIFGLILVRGRDGIIFDSKHPDINAVFILYGSADQRSFHLRALTSIAQIVSNPHWDERWLNAKTEQAMKDVVLLSDRKRITMDKKDKKDKKEKKKKKDEQ